MTEKTSLVRRFSVKGLGPIVAEFSFPFRPGVGVLRGDQGVGKSTCLEAVNGFLGSAFRVTANDIVGRAELEYDGVTMKYAAKRVFSKGQRPEDLLVFVEDAGDLADFVKPREKDPLAADSRRMKWLLRMSGATVPFTDFADLVPADKDYPVVSIEDAKKLADLVDQASKVKRALETESRRVETLAKDERTKEQGLRIAIGEIDISAPSDHAELQAAHAEAVGQFSRLDEQRKAAETAKESRIRAASQLSASKTTYIGPTVEQAQAADDEAAAQNVAANKTVQDLERQLELAKQVVKTATANHKTTQSQLTAAKAHDKAVAEMTGLLEGELPQPPEEEDLEGARIVMGEAAMALEQSVLVREAKAKKVRADDHLATAKKHEKWAGKLRDAAAATDDVLSRAVKVPDMKILGGRLVYTGKGNEEFFDRLSDGERWKVGIQIVSIRVSEKTGDGTKVATLEQAAWGELSPTSREWVHNCAFDSGVALVTAEAADGPLRYVFFGETDSVNA